MSAYDYTSPETKLRTLATMNPILQGSLGSDPLKFRWYDGVLIQNIVKNLTAGQAAVRVNRVSTIRGVNQSGIMNLSRPLFQIDVLSLNSETARKVANDVIVFLGTIDLCSNGQFESPYREPSQNPNFLMNQMHGIIPNPQPDNGPVYFERLDVRLANREDLAIN